ncbi:DsbA family protein [Rubellimicrobium sp. CFH 75288]|uniref:DsbA family protein n=1 Tax=Rubellimicrobium sp. CFH 75288 TaxID=2697034 RepID=UPI001413546A|nr:DsbA family protein [Rubellimicrobium sp. CFH 75288]NAZ35333.1 thioredoxin domain-containing protein [Rubellimicrobium sp. CFH 75288]
MARSTLAALCLATLAAAPSAGALDLTAMTAAEREAFRAEVRAYLLENPEVLMEAIGVLEAREQEAQAAADAALVAANRDAAEGDGHAWVGGNPDGDVTLVEFFDYRCGYCRRAFEDVEGLVAGDGNIRFVLRELPILGEQSLLAARFALTVRELHGDEAYKDAHDALMALRTDVTSETLSRLAEGLGLEPAPILAAMDSPAVTETIESNRLLAQRLRISGTPTFLIGGRIVRGYVPASVMEGIVADARAEEG